MFIHQFEELFGFLHWPARSAAAQHENLSQDADSDFLGCFSPNPQSNRGMDAFQVFRLKYPAG